jgi:hypothetical protein
MEQNPSWEANSHSASQEISWLLLNPKVHYRVNNSPPVVPVLRQVHPVYIFPPNQRFELGFIFTNLTVFH